MQNNLIPVRLEFKNIASNTNLHISLKDDDAGWSLGGFNQNSIGFGYNLGENIADANPAIASIELNSSIISITTAAVNGSSSNISFELTLFLKTKEQLDNIEGYCTLNEDAKIFAYIGDLEPVEWVNGIINAMVKPVLIHYRQVAFIIEGAKPGNKVTITLAPHKEGSIAWTTGPEFESAAGIQINSISGNLNLSKIQLDPNHITFELPGNSVTSNEMVNFNASFYLVKANIKVKDFYLRVFSDDNITVFAKVGSSQPQLVNHVNTLFKWNP